MSLLSKATGIHISKHGVHIEPLKALGTLATVGSFGGLGPLAGIAGKVGSMASKIPYAAKAGTILSGAKRVLGSSGGVPQVLRNGLPANVQDLITGGGAAPGAGGTPAPNAGDGGGMDWLGLAEGGLAGLSAYNSAKASGRAGKYQDMALQQAGENWQQGAPLRAQGRARMLNPVTPDLTSTYNDPTNAFSAPVTSAPVPQRRLLAAGRA